MSTGTMTNSWTRKATSGDGGDFELPPGGSYPGCLVGLIDIGTHKSTFSGETKELHKILLVFELTGEFDTRGETFKVMKDFTFSLNTKAKLRGFLEGWAGRKFADNEEIDLSSFLTMNGVINITEGMSGAGKKFVDISSVTRPMKGLTVPPATVEPFAWTFDGWDPNQDPPVPDWVPPNYGRKVVDEIKASSEWSKLHPF